MANAESTQDKNLVRVSTVLPDNALIATRLSISETLSEGFSIVVTAFSEKRHDLTTEDLVGTPLTAVLVQQDNSLRYFNGYVQEITATGSERAGQRSTYKLTVVSWLQLLLGKRRDNRIFQEKNVKQIIEEVFKPLGSIADYKFDISGEHPEWRYCTQYEETDLNFFNRLCQREGLAYYFLHENGAHKLHIVDVANIRSLADNKPKIVEIQAGTPAFDHFSHWQSTGKFVAGTYTQRTYNYLKPTQLIEGSEKIKGDALKIPKVTDIEHYSYSEQFHTSQEGKGSVSTKGHGASQAVISQGAGNCRHLKVGHTIQVALPGAANFAEKGKEFTLTSVSINADDASGVMNCFVEALPKGNLLFPASSTPTINSLQTAVVTGPKGEEIHTDQLGRIKAQFHWDRVGKKDENSTCWLRVMQGFAGNNYGAHFTPRVGHEVVVAFENGNPDRPFVIGSLFHQEHKPPYSEQLGSRSGVRTRSTKGGGETNFNELYFEDTKGKEEVYFQAEKDLNAVVKNDETREVGNDQTSAIKHDRKMDVGNDHTETIKNKQTITVGKDQQNNIKNNQTTEVGKKSVHKVGKELILEAGSKIVLKVGGSSIEITGSKIAIKSSGQVDVDGGKVQLN